MVMVELKIVPIDPVSLPEVVMPDGRPHSGSAAFAKTQMSSLRACYGMHSGSCGCSRAGRLLTRPSAVRSWTCPSPPVRWSRLRFNRAGLESRLPPVRITAHDKHPEVGCSTPVYFEIKELAHQSSRTPHRPGPRGRPEGRPGDPVMIWACGT